MPFVTRRKAVFRYLVNNGIMWKFEPFFVMVSGEKPCLSPLFHKSFGTERRFFGKLVSTIMHLVHLTLKLTTNLN